MGRLKSKRWLRWTVEALVLVAVFAAVHVYTTRTAVRGMAPEIRGQLLDGGDFDLSQWRGRPVLVHFWATWCPICRMEQGSIEDLARDHAVITVATQSGTSFEVRDWLRSKGVRMPVLVDVDGSIAAAYGARGVPATFILDAAGHIRFVEFGYTTKWGLLLRLWLARWWGSA